MATHRILYVFLALIYATSAFVLPSEKFHSRLKPGCDPIACTDSIRTSLQSSTTSNLTYDEEHFIITALLRNSLFSGISEASLNELVNGFETHEIHRGEEIITQGDSCIGGYVYLVADGQCKVVVDGNTVPEPYGTIGPADIFGELGVLYDGTRAATIRARSEKVVYYQVSGELFKTIYESKENLASLSDLHAIDEAINMVSGTHALYGGDVIMPYKPERLWLWQQFGSTVLKISLGSTLGNMAFCAAFVVFVRYCTGDPPFELSVGAPDNSIPLVANLDLVGKIWDIERTLTTFVLTFFVNQGFIFWKKVYQLARDVQGKLSDFNMLVATNVVRDENGMLTPESEKFLDDIACYSRLFHMLMWASKSERFAVLTTPEGLKRLESRGLMRPRQLEVLQNANLPEKELFTAPLEWMMIRSTQAMADGTLAGDTATKGMLLKQIVAIRSYQRAITDNIDGRMPLAYAHLVQILVDTFVLTAPIALYARLGDFSIIAVGTLTIFYAGLNNLAKIFLDPLNNENFCENSIFMDLGVFVRETNGQSVQFKKAGKELPF